MSRSYAVLAAALLGVAGLAGIAQVSGSGTDAAAPPATVIDRLDDTVDTVAAGPSPKASNTDASPIAPTVPATPDCTLSTRLELGDDHPQVECLEARLIAAGMTFETGPDERFDDATDSALRLFQELHGLVADGIVGPETARQLGSWSGPDVLPPDDDTCPASGRAAVVDRHHQRAWLCDGGQVVDVMPMTSAVSQPEPGTYEVYDKDLRASSDLGEEYSEMTHFVAFAHGKYQGARIAFHSVPTYPSGEYVQPLDSVGSPELHGDSAGCIRVLPDDAEAIWDWLDVGDTVVVVT